MLKGKVRGVYLRGRTYWLAKQVNGRRSFVSLETDDYIAALQRAREIMDSPELQPAQSFTAEVERFLKHKFETNRYSKMSADSKRSCLVMFAESVKDVPPANVTTTQCRAYYDSAKARVVPSTAESYMFTLRSFFNWCVQQNLCRRNPVIGIQLDRIDRKGRTRFANLELAQRLIQNAPNDDLRLSYSADSIPACEKWKSWKPSPNGSISRLGRSKFAQPKRSGRKIVTRAPFR